MGTHGKKGYPQIVLHPSGFKLKFLILLYMNRSTQFVRIREYPLSFCGAAVRKGPFNKRRPGVTARSSLTVFPFSVFHSPISLFSQPCKSIFSVQIRSARSKGLPQWGSLLGLRRIPVGCAIFVRMSRYSPPDQRRRPGESAAERSQRDQITLRNPAICKRFVQRNRNGGRSGISVFMDVAHILTFA